MHKRVHTHTCNIVAVNDPHLFFFFLLFERHEVRMPDKSTLEGYNIFPLRTVKLKPGGAARTEVISPLDTSRRD